MKRLSGLMSPPSTAARGVDMWIGSLGDIPASHSASQGGVSATVIPETSGPPSPTSSAQSSPEDASLKTWASIFGMDTSTLYDQTSKALVTESRKRSTRRQKSALPTGENDCSSSPSGWMTPNAPSPHDSDNTAGAGGKKQVEIADQAVAWYTPTVRDSKDGFSPTMVNATNGQLGRQAPRTTVGGQPYPEGVKVALNPLFVEWLMGWPIGTTDLESWATQSCPRRPPTPSES
jgi:hypothetical protein